MKRIFTALLLFILITSQTQVMGVYAQTQAQLIEDKQQASRTIEAVDSLIDRTVEKIDTKISHGETKTKLKNKHSEIEEYLEEVQQDIQSENSSEDIQEKVEEAKKVVVLKVVAGVTPTEDIEDSIDSSVAESASEKREALAVAQESLETPSGDYSIIVRTAYTQEKVESLFAKFDDSTKISALYSVAGENYFEIFLEENSIFRQEMMEDIDRGILPASFLGVQIVMPEVFSVFSSDLSGENLGATWGVERYRTYDFFDESSISSSSVSVGVVDTGIDYTHSDLASAVNVQKGRDFVNDDDDAMDDQGHGTHVAGTIAGQLNGAGVLGVNPHVELVPLKICTSSGFCPSYAVIRAVEHASQQDIDILNMSLGGRGNPSEHAICDAIDAYTQSGGLVVASAGNSDIDASLFIPGGCSNALAVGAVDRDNARASFSNFGSKVDVSAPGVDIYSTYPVSKGSYAELSGTSMASPHVTGLVSLMLAIKGEMTLSEVKFELLSNPEAVTTDNVSKPIASAVDVPLLLSSLISGDETPVAEENPDETQGQDEAENIAEYILNYEETPEVYDDVPETSHVPLDDLQLSDIDTEIQDGEAGSFVPEVFDMTPRIQLDQVEINSADSADYLNSDTQSFSIVDEAQEDVDEETSTGRIVIPEVISDGPVYEETPRIELVPGIDLPEQDGVDVNAHGESEDIIEVIEEDYSLEITSPSVEALIEEDSIGVQSANNQELDVVPDPASYSVQIGDDYADLEDSEGLPDDELTQMHSLSDEEYAELGPAEGIGVQRVYEAECDIYVGQRCTVTLRRHSSAYYFHTTTAGIVDAFGGSRYARIDGLVAGTTYVNLFLNRDDEQEHRIKVTVRDIPEVQYLSCEVKKGSDCLFSFPELSSDLDVDYQTTNSGLRTDFDSSKRAVISTRYYGKHLATETVEMFTNGYKFAEFEINVVPNVPEFECTLLQDGQCRVRLPHDAVYVFQHMNGGIVSASSNGKSEYAYVNADAPGEELTYALVNGAYHASIRTTVIGYEEISVPNQKCQIWELGRECEVEITGAYQLDYTTSTGGIVQLRRSGNILTIESVGIGDTTVNVKFGGITVGTIDVNVGTQADSYRCQMNPGKTCEVYLGSNANYMQFEQTTGGLVDLYLGGYRNRYLQIDSQQAGNLKIYVWNNRYDRYEAQIEVFITEPTQSSCSVLEGGKCIIEGLPKNFNYQEMQNGEPFGEKMKDGNRTGTPQYIKLNQFVQSDGSKDIDIQGLRSGSGTMGIYKYSFYMDYALHMIDVDVIEAPIEASSYCDTRVNGSCRITLRNIGTNKYSIQVSEGGMTDMTLKRDYLYMKGVKEGTFEILITNNETRAVAHRGEVKIEGEYNVHVPRPNTVLSETAINLPVGEARIIEIEEGNSATAYKVISDYSNIEVSQASSTSFRIKATSAENTTSRVHFIDTEKEFVTAKVYVRVVEPVVDDGGSEDSSEESGTGGGSEETPVDAEDELHNLIEELFGEFGIQEAELRIAYVTYAWHQESWEKIEQHFRDTQPHLTDDEIENISFQLNKKVHSLVSGQHPDLLWKVYDRVVELEELHDGNLLYEGLFGIIKFYIPTEVSNYYKNNPEIVVDTIGDMSSIGVSLIPVIGEGYDVYTLIQGRDPITGEELNTLTTTLTLAGLFSLAGSGVAARELGQAGLKKIADDLNLSEDQVIEIATEVAKEYKVDNIQDIVALQDKFTLKYFNGLVKSKAFVAKHTRVTTGGRVITELDNTVSEVSMTTNSNLTIWRVFKGSQDGFAMSDVVLEQIRYAGNDPIGLKNILLDEVIDEDVLEALTSKGTQHVIDNWGSVGGLDGMTRKMLEKLGKELEDVRIHKELFGGETIYHIQLTIK